MPGFAKSLSNAQLSDLVHFARTQFSRESAWPDLRARIDALRPER